MNFDVLMPSVLFLVTFAAMFLGRRVETKLKATVENREFKTRDTLVLVAVIVVAVSVIAFVPSYAVIALFMFSYSSLLFTVSYVFSDLKTKRMTIYCVAFLVASVLASVAGLLGVIPSELRFFGILAFAGLAGCTLLVFLFTRLRSAVKQTWYVAALSPALFLLLFVFFNKTFVWFPFLIDVFGITFALLIVIYLNGLFTWKAVFIFAGFITAMDIVLVWVTGQMVQAAKAISGLNLPVLVSFPTVPPMFGADGILFLNLGLGDFFFAGILTSQTLKRFGAKVAVLSLATVCLSFGLFELILLNKSLYDALPVKALPATLPILIGWLPVVGVKLLFDRTRRKKQEPSS